MHYQVFVNHLARLSGHHEDTVASILFHLSDALLILQNGDSLRTRLGVFRAVVHKGKRVVPPRGGDPMQTSPTLLVKLRSGKRLRRPVQERKSESPA